MLWLPRKKGCLFPGDIREVTSDLGPRVYGEFQQYGCRSRDDLGGGLDCREVAGGELYTPAGARVELPAMQSGHLTRGSWPIKSPKNILEKKKQTLDLGNCNAIVKIKRRNLTCLGFLFVCLFVFKIRILKTSFSSWKHSNGHYCRKTRVLPVLANNF